MEGNTRNTQSNANINGNVNENVLDALNKQQLIKMVLNLNQTISKLHEDFQRVTNFIIWKEIYICHNNIISQGNSK